MNTQSSASPNPSTTQPAPRRLHPTTVMGTATMIAKLRQLMHGQQITPFAAMSAEDQEDLLRAATSLVNSQDPARTRQAMDMAMAAAEGVAIEAGLPSDTVLKLMRQAASTAVLTYRLALEGSLDQQGGVQ